MREPREFILPRSGQAPLKISATRWLENEGQRRNGREQTRWHDLAIYYLDRDQYVAAIAYRTNWQGENGHDAAEVVAAAGDVGRVLRDYDPLAHVAGFPPGEAYAERQRRLESDLVGRYQSQVSEILADPVFAEDVSAAIYGPAVRARRHALCRQLEIASLALTRSEACAICDALNGTILDEHSWQSLWCEVYDADRLNGLGEKWEIDAKQLATRIRDASPGAKLALAEAVEEFWRAHVDDPIEEGLRAVGLLTAAGEPA
jgi:hypothetical protein